MKIVLLGYMASGKSLIGKKLSDVLDYKFIDLDSFIEEKEQRTISNIFSESREIYFRKIEHEYLKEVLSSDLDIVLSLGGGTPCYFENMKIISESNNVKSIYLNVTIQEIVKRLKNEKNKRPLISHIDKEDDIIEFVGKHLFERSNFYRRATIIVDGNSKPEMITETIILNLF